MSITRPAASLKVTHEAHPVTAKFTNLVTEADMRSALSLLPKSVKTATFADRVARFTDRRAYLYTDSKDSGSNEEHRAFPPEELKPEAITYFFNHNPCIQHVTFSEITSTHTTALATALASDQTLSSLCLKENELRDSDLAVLNEIALKTNTTLRTLDISDGRNLHGKAVTVLSHTHLTALHTASNGLNGNHVALLLNTNPQLLTLNVSLNNLCDTNNDNSDSDVISDTDDEDAKAAVAAEAKAPKQTHLLAALPTAIQNHKCLCELNLMTCELNLVDENDAEGVRLKEQLYIKIFSHPTLTRINISYNLLDAHTLHLIATLTARSRQLTHLDISGCILHPAIQQDVYHPNYPRVYMYTLRSLRMLASSRLTHLFLNRNNLHDRELSLLKPILRTNKTFIELCLEGNKITSIGVAHLLPFLERTETLQVLNLSLNPIGFKGLEEILGALQRNRNCAVHTLVLHSCSIDLPTGLTEIDRNNFLKKIPRSLLNINFNQNGIQLNDLELMQGIKQKLRFNQTLLRYTQRLSPLVIFARAHREQGLMHRSMIPLTREVTGYLATDGAMEVDIRAHRKEKEVNAAAAPIMEK